MNKLITLTLAATLAAAIPAQDTDGTEPPRGERLDRQGPSAKLRAYLRAHPRLFRRLKHAADQDGDGALSQDERQAFMAAARQHLANRAERVHDWADRNDDGKVGPLERRRAKAVHDWADRNDDGKVGPLERRRAKAVHDWADRNDDGKVGPLERRRAKAVHDWADRNDDGKVGPLERRRAKAVHDRVDRNDDGKVGPAERRRANQVRNRRNG